MTNPQLSPPHTGHADLASATQALFPGAMACMSADHAQSYLQQYLLAHRQAAQSGPQAAAPPVAGVARGFAFGPPPFRSAMKRGGVQLIAWDGFTQQRPHPILSELLDVVDTSQIADAVKQAAADPRVKSILLVVDSPGGAVPGTPELAALVADAARTKPVVVLTDGALTSAAYWIASGASAIYATGPTVSAGSIGVVLLHTHTPRTDGSVVTEITAGKYKRAGSGNKPLSAEDRAYLLETVDHLTQVFVNEVAKNRRLSPSAVADQQGRTYIGQQAVDAGLLDGFKSQSELETQLAADPSKFMRKPGAAPVRAPARAAARAPTQAPVQAPARAPVAAAVSAPARASATTWPTKLQPAAMAPVLPTAVLEAAGQAEADLCAEAAELVRTHKLTTGRWPKVMTSWKAWESAGALRARQDGCTLVEGIKREGYLHPYVSVASPTKRGTPGAKPCIELTRPQLAERAAAWAQFKGIAVTEALKFLGFKG